MRQKELSDYQSTGHDCPNCDMSFGTLRGVSVHHSKMHDGSFSAKEQVSCEVCGSEVERYPKHIKKHDKFFCGDSCESEFKTGREPQNKDREERKCDWCASSFEVTSNSSQRFCCMSCRSKWISDSQGQNKIKETCNQCGKTFKRWASQGTGDYCSPECRHKRLSERTGPDHPLHEGGRDYYVAIRRALGPTGWETLRKKHNNDECEMCGDKTSPRDRDLSLHHIVPVLSGGTNEAYNFMTLCEPCHSNAESYCSDLPGFDRILK